jgi:hypothetical protein
MISSINEFVNKLCRLSGEERYRLLVAEYAERRADVREFEQIPAQLLFEEIDRSGRTQSQFWQDATAWKAST